MNYLSNIFLRVLRSKVFLGQNDNFLFTFFTSPWTKIFAVEENFPEFGERKLLIPRSSDYIRISKYPDISMKFSDMISGPQSPDIRILDILKKS